MAGCHDKPSFARGGALTRLLCKSGARAGLDGVDFGSLLSTWTAHGHRWDMPTTEPGAIKGGLECSAQQGSGSVGISRRA